MYEHKSNEEKCHFFAELKKMKKNINSLRCYLIEGIYHDEIGQQSDDNQYAP